MIYEKVLSYCEKEGMSIAAFEKKCAIGNGVVRAWKDNNSHPSVSTLQKMEKCTGIPIAKWLCLVYNKNTQNCRGDSPKLQREIPQ